uniref:Mitochondrial fission process protein 1 n=1 Tax=Echinococcus granulosus TaxID=6210 RepID=A0A068WUH1_ECHGR|nr:hypothetical protein EgrG_002026200 [Echinococcus granulosus]
MQHPRSFRALTAPGHLHDSKEVARKNRDVSGLAKEFTEDAQLKNQELGLARSALRTVWAVAYTAIGVSPFKLVADRILSVPPDIILQNSGAATHNGTEYVP